MPPKRKAAGGAKAGGKKAKAAEKPPLEKKTTLQRAGSELRKKAAADATNSKVVPGKIKPDSLIPSASTYTVVDDYDAMLNQTNIGHNNNKYYVIQCLQRGTFYYTWNRWGRVGENGQSSMKSHGSSKEKAVKDFEKKFTDKTRNKWAERANFKPSKGKYTLLEMSYEDDDNAQASNVVKSADGLKTQPSKLDKSTHALVKLLFSKDMFRDAMADLNIDVKKMPLGKLSKQQIAKGFEVLEKIEAVIDQKSTGNLVELSSQFYTLVPHNFGRLIPPVIRTREVVRSKMDMLLVLSDIVVAQDLEKSSEKEIKSVDKVPDPVDVNYDSLKAELKLVDKNSDEFKVIQTYLQNTKGGNSTILNAWRVDRDGEERRHVTSGDCKLDNRKLLWHGTNIAVVAAILKSGLRIMPHSGGRLGAGIYFASEQAKSAGYTARAGGNIGIMFLNEVALGKSKIEHCNQFMYKSAPSGYHSVLGQGRQEPDNQKDTTLTFDKRKVVVPQGSVKPTKEATNSGFWNSEYLIYKESQCRIRYLLQIKF